MDRIDFYSTDNILRDYLENSKGSGMTCFHYHNSYEIYILIEGKRKYLIDSKLYNIEPGTVVLIKPEITHKTEAVTPFKRLVINFTDEFLKKYFTKQAVGEMLMCFDAVTYLLNPIEFRNIFDEMVAVKDEKSFTMANLISGLLMLLNKHSENGNMVIREDSTISHVLDYVHKNYITIKSLEEIAKQCYITKSHMCRIFKISTNMTIVHYINWLKIRDACQYLLKTDMKIYDIALKCGFESSIYFCKLFKEYQGLSSSQYRQQNK